jgi:hypothetical protein
MKMRLASLLGLAVLLSASVIPDTHAMRWYSPSTGRWLSRDPIGDRPNLYAGLLNNPVEYVDADGREESYWPPGHNSPPKTPPFPYPPSTPPGPVPGSNTPSGTFYPIPSWFNSPPDEGKPCCCYPAASLRGFGRADNPGRFYIQMNVNYTISGCFKDMAIIWWTCWRPDGTAGVIPSCVGSPSCTFFAGTSSLIGPYITQVRLRYLSCENNVWVKHEQSAGHTFFWGWSGWY